MFEDLQPTIKKEPEQSNNAPVPPPVPARAVLDHEPEDIFATVEKDNHDWRSDSRPVEPVVPTTKKEPVVGPVEPLTKLPADIKFSNNFFSKKIVLIFGGVLLLVIIVLGIFLWMRNTNPVPNIDNNQAIDNRQENQANQPQNDRPEPPVNQNQPVNEQDNINQPAEQVDVNTDSDSDGLTDKQEATLGTDPYKVDSDQDGLLDKEEVMIYKTDPLNTDSDGDGFTDGIEVKNGYNPKGPGKLQNLP